MRCLFKITIFVLPVFLLQLIMGCWGLQEISILGFAGDSDSLSDSDEDIDTEDFAESVDICWANQIVTSSSESGESFGIVYAYSADTFIDGSVAIAGEGFTAVYDAQGELDWQIETPFSSKKIMTHQDGRVFMIATPLNENAPLTMRVVSQEGVGANTLFIGDAVQNEGPYWGVSTEPCGSFTLSDDDTIWVTAAFNGNITLGQEPSEQVTLNSGSVEESATYLAQYTDSFELIQTFVIDKPLFPSDIATATNGDLIITGVSPDIFRNIELHRFDSSGQQQWWQTVAVQTVETGFAWSLKPRLFRGVNGQMTISSNFYETMDIFGTNGLEAPITSPTYTSGGYNQYIRTNFAAEFDSSCGLDWVWTTAAADTDNYTSAEDAATDRDATGGLVMAGVLAGEVVFDQGGSGETSISESPEYESFVSRINSDGTFDKVVPVVNSGAEKFDIEVAAAMPDGSVTIAGHFSGDMSVELSDGTTVEMTSDPFEWGNYIVNLCDW